MDRGEAGGVKVNGLNVEGEVCITVTTFKTTRTLTNFTLIIFEFSFCISLVVVRH